MVTNESQGDHCGFWPVVAWCHCCERSISENEWGELKFIEETTVWIPEYNKRFFFEHRQCKCGGTLSRESKKESK